jgi:hypothetical protein
MPVIVSYTVHLSYQDKSIQMCGAFLSRRHFDEFAKQEVQRNCYRELPFVVGKVKDVSVEEYNKIVYACQE